MTGYPNGPGFKESETSREAAQAVALRASALRDRVYVYIVAHPGRSADTIAEALGESPWAIRPRVSELRKTGMIVNDGRGRNPSGMSVHLWRAATYAEMKG
ncbi:hypothetical protein [Bradyrhizobium sp. Tv2a-2]|uniref:hypothetical protein n=1 Tax=Bradyrhizobium sp. Tv2a-2 TaxID=113395 RepID=UPI0004161828|nr:hypothetical protein [Bradyrhizobium sp. Tv2a-2]